MKMEIYDILPPDTIFFPQHPDNVAESVTWTGRVLYSLRRPYCYVWEHKGIERAIYVRKGFKNDGSSVPRLAQTIGGLHQDSMRPAAIVHDLFYEYRGKFPNKDGRYYRRGPDGMWSSLDVQISRKAADRLFLRIMREMEMPWTLRKRAYWSVRLAGWIAWRT